MNRTHNEAPLRSGQDPTEDDNHPLQAPRWALLPTVACGILIIGLAVLTIGQSISSPSEGRYRLAFSLVLVAIGSGCIAVGFSLLDARWLRRTWQTALLAAGVSVVAATVFVIVAWHPWWLRGVPPRVRR